MLTISGLINESFGQRDLNISYNIAMMTYINELDCDRHTHMAMPEFIDFLGRVSDKMEVNINVR